MWTYWNISKSNASTHSSWQVSYTGSKETDYPEGSTTVVATTEDYGKETGAEDLHGKSSILQNESVCMSVPNYSNPLCHCLVACWCH